MVSCENFLKLNNFFIEIPMKKEIMTLLLIIVFLICNYILPVFKIMDIFHILLPHPNPSISYYYDGSMTTNSVVFTPYFISDVQNLTLTVFNLWTKVNIIFLPVLILLFLIEPIYGIKGESDNLLINFPHYTGMKLLNYYTLILWLIFFLTFGHYILFILIMYVIVPPPAFLITPTLNRITLILFIIGWLAIYIAYSIIYSKNTKKINET